MAEMTQPTGKQGNKPAKKSTRVDLTPMVDLGFLLITFFIFTTTMSAPKAMKLVMPDDSQGRTSEGGEGKTLQLELDANNTISYYYGNDSTHKFTTDYSASGIRKVIQDKRKQVAEKYNDASELIVLISPKNASSYGNMVDILDEMLINDIKRYMIL
jgi:biopolymer transport protein ExbD